MDVDVPRVIKSNLEFYDTIKAKSPNGYDKAYTVLATLNEVGSGKLIALATGTQANLRVYPDDIEDCHAESLLKRAYKRYLLDAALARAPVTDGVIARGSTSQEAFAKHCGQQELMMFVSQFPCGLVRRFEGEEPVDEETGAVIKRKPGRGVAVDGKVVYVQRDNCLNKLKRWNSTFGLQGKSLHEQLGARSRLTHIVIGDCEPEPSFDYGAQLKQFEQELSLSEVAPRIKCSLVSMRRAEFVFHSSEKQPQPVATIWWQSPTGNQAGGTVEYVVDGRRKGLTRGQSQSGRLEWRLKSGDCWLRSDLERVQNLIHRQAGSV